MELSVSDTGTGIPANHLPKIFDPYFTTKQHGSGLGLATCYSIISKHAGTITATSTLGQGSTFTIRIPATGQVTPPAPEIQKTLTGGIGRVLVMDDERTVRKIAQAMLESLGYGSSAPSTAMRRSNSTGSGWKRENRSMWSSWT